MALTLNEKIVHQMYIAYYQRPADPEGLAYWLGQIATAGGWPNVAAAFGAPENAEYQGLYGGKTRAEIVTELYQSSFNRAAVQEEIDFWVASAFADTLIGFAIINGAQNADLAAVTKKVSFSVELGNYVVNNAGYGQVADPKALLKDIDANSDVSEGAVAGLVGNIDTGVVGNAFTLTAGADAIPGLTGSGGSSSNTGNDTISAIIDTNTVTLNSSDTLNAGSGNDTLNVRVVSLTNSTTATPVLTSVETVSVNNIDSSGNTATINLVQSTGTTTVEFKDNVINANTTFLNVSNTAAISLNNADGTSAGQNVNFGPATARTGTNDSFAITIANGSGSSTQFAGFNLVTTDGATDDTSFETANITVAGAKSFVLAGTAMAGLTTVNVTGETTGVTTGFGLTLDQMNNFAGLKTVNASGMTGGGLDIDAVGSTATGFSFTGSAASDRVVLERTTLNAASTLNGGNGKDTLATTSFNNLALPVVNSATGFEVLESVNATNGLDASSFTNINEFLFSGGPNGSRVNITGVENNDRFVFASNQGNSDEAVRFTADNPGTSVLFEMRASAETNGEIQIFSSQAMTAVGSAIGFDGGISSVTIDSTGQNAEANLIMGVNSFGNFAFNNDNGLANFTITGSQNLSIGVLEGVELTSGGTINTAGFSSGANVNASAFTGDLHIAGSNSNDTIIGGSGNDLIYGLGGTNQLTGNGGSDQFRLSDGTSVIKDFVKGTDKVGLNDGFANTIESFEGTVLSSSDYVDNRAGITSIGAADDLKVIELQSSLSTSQIQNDLGAAVFSVVLVFNSTTNKGEMWIDNNWADANNREQIATFDNVVSLVGVTDFSNTDFVEFSV